MKNQQASTTAKLIAASTVLLGQLPQHSDIVPAQAVQLCQQMLSTSWFDRMWCASVKWPPTRWLWQALERMILPGIMSHYWRRKLWIERQCMLALQQGVQRVIVFGAGLDTLALRYAAQWPHVQWVEVDHPATQAYKIRGLESLKGGVPANLQWVALDLSKDAFPESLKQSVQPTLVIMEGLLMYLPIEKVRQLFSDDMSQLSSSSVQILFSYMVRWPRGRHGFRPASALVDAWLSWQQEPFKWAMQEDQVPSWLVDQGFETLLHATPPFEDEPIRLWQGLQGENLVLCRRADEVHF